MSSQKYAYLLYGEMDHEEGEQKQEGYIWHCKLAKEECNNTSFSNAKPMCDRCMIAKQYKANVKKGKSLVRAMRENKLKEVN